MGALRFADARRLLEVEPGVCVSVEKRKGSNKVREEVVGWLKEEEMGALQAAAATSMAGVNVNVSEVMSV